MAARAQAAALGRPDFDAIYVPHPIQDQTRAEIEAKADAVLGELIARLVKAFVGKDLPIALLATPHS